MKIRSKCVWGGEVVCAGGGGRTQARLVRRTPAHPGRRAVATYMSMATTTLVRAAMTQAVTNM